MRSGIDDYSSFLPRSGVAEFMRLLYRKDMQQSNTVHVFLHENLWEPQPDLQLHLTDSSKDAWAAVRSVVTGRSLPSTSFQPQSCGWNATPLSCCTWWQNLRLWQTVASEVRARHLGCTDEVPVVVFLRRISNVATNPALLQARLYIN